MKMKDKKAEQIAAKKKHRELLKSNRRKEATLDRVEPIKIEKPTILIVCEGEKTEPNYFKSFVRILPRGSVQVDVVGEGCNTLSLVEDAEKRSKESSKRNMPYDRVWVVFDRDSFSPSNFDNAISKAESKGFGCVWSNEAFELWYILHFEYRNTGMSRDEYKGRLTAHIGEEYKKNDPDMYGKLVDKQQDAIRNATKLLGTHGRLPPSRSNPATTVHELVQELMVLQDIR
jgi:hypothetical protein